MILLWILLGITSAIAFIVSYYWIKFGAPKIVLATGLFGVSLFLFSVVWTILSMLKGELLSASLGLLTFGLPGILLVASGWKLFEAKNQEQ